MDEAALRQIFTPDADQLVSTGQGRRGIEDLVKGAAASSRKENSRSTVTAESVRLLGPDTAVADGRYENKLDDLVQDVAPHHCIGKLTVYSGRQKFGMLWIGTTKCSVTLNIQLQQNPDTGDVVKIQIS